VPVGTVIGRWSQASGTGALPAMLGKGQATPSAGGGGGKAATPNAPSAQSATVRPGSRIVATPLARRLARHHGVDLELVRGSGSGGRIRAADVEAAAAGQHASPPPAEERPPASRSGAVDTGTRVTPGPVHAAMARRLADVKRTVPHFYLASEADASELLALRESLIGDPAVPRITINHIALAAVGRALLDLPWANRVWADGELLAFGSADVGIAVHTPHGLFAPLLRDAGRMDLAGVAAGATRLVEKARGGRLEPDDMTGGAMTVSNAGMFDVTYLTPIISPGQSAILGVGSVRRTFRPDDAGGMALRREIGLVLACDHRVFDGVAGLEVLRRIIGYLEKPQQLLTRPEHAR
jgi:pyruvate dehydrogenase E2 component (dihydrolipoamide acetyltransferase)